MRIAVVSDTHGQEYYMKKVIEKITDADMMIHLGDNSDDADYIGRFFKGRVLKVRGNCDFISTAPLELIEIIENKKVFISHGHKYGVKYGMGMFCDRAEEINADIALFGHTHESLCDYKRGIWFINPGSVAFPRDGSRSIAIIDLENGAVNTSLRII